MEEPKRSLQSGLAQEPGWILHGWQFHEMDRKRSKHQKLESLFFERWLFRWNFFDCGEFSLVFFSFVCCCLFALFYLWSVCCAIRQIYDLLFYQRFRVVVMKGENVCLDCFYCFTRFASFFVSDFRASKFSDLIGLLLWRCYLELKHLQSFIVIFLRFFFYY